MEKLKESLALILFIIALSLLGLSTGGLLAYSMLAPLLGVSI